MQTNTLLSIHLVRSLKVTTGVHQPWCETLTHQIHGRVELTAGGPLEMRLDADSPNRLQIFRLAETPAALALDVKICIDQASPPLPGEFAIAGSLSLLETKLASALRDRLIGDLTVAWQDSTPDQPILDWVHDDSDAGLAARDRAMAGHFEEGPEITIHSGAFDCALSNVQPLEIHVLPRPRQTARSSSLGWTYGMGGEGRVMLVDHNAEDDCEAWNMQQALLSASGGLYGHDNTGWTLSFGDRRCLSAEQTSLLLVPLAEHYALALPDVISSGPIETSFNIALPASSASAWLHAPGQRDAGSGPTWSAVSVAIQSALRRWLPYIYFSSGDRWNDTEAAWALLVYSQSRAFIGRTRADLTWDVLDPRTLPRVVRSASFSLPDILESVRNMLIAGNRLALADDYRPRRRSHVLKFVVRDRKLMNSLLAAESFIVEEFVKFGSACRTPSGEVRAARQLATYTSVFLKATQSKLRRLYRQCDFSGLLALLLIEATRVLAARRGLPDLLRAQVRLRTPTPGTFRGADWCDDTCSLSQFYCIKRQPWG
jgi:hypothetical protein